MRTKRVIEFGLLDIARYPFSSDALEYIKKIGFTIDELNTTYGKAIIKEAIDRIKNAITNKATNLNLKVKEDYSLEILSFYTSILLLRLINDRYLNRIFSVREAKIFYNYCLNDEIEKIFYLATKTFGWDIRVLKASSTITKIGIYFVNYVNNLPSFSNDWKLVNREIIKGYVVVNKKEICRLLSEEVRRKIINSIESPKKINIPEFMFEAVEEISKIWIPYSERIKLNYATLASSGINLYPPCIRLILEKIKRGENISHAARFAVATFLLNIGKKIDEVVQVFSSLPDFNESITRYQVEHLAGLRGSKKKYLPFKCENMKAYGLCHPDKYCEGIKHPLQYLYKRRNELWKRRSS